MDATVSVVYEGTRHKIEKFGPSDLVAFERHFQLPATVFQTDEDGKSEARFEWICFLAYRALRRMGVIEKDVQYDDDFLDKIEEIDTEQNEEDGPDPTDPAPKPA